MSQDDRRIAVVIPMPSDPPWELFDAIPTDIDIIVADDSNGKLAPAPRPNVQYFDYTAQEKYSGEHYVAMPHKSAASRNFGHYYAYKEGYDVIIALDYDCRTRDGWLDTHLKYLGTLTDNPALKPTAERGWVNSIECEGFYSRGYPYEYRTPELSAVEETTASGQGKINMGVWDNVLDLNGIDKYQTEPPYDPGLRGDTNYVALGNIPVCGMNTAFTADITPAYFFLPDVWVNDGSPGNWQLSRHDDIWGGYIVKRLMDLRGDLFAYGAPIVEHTRQTPLERVTVLEQYMHLTSMPFYDIVEEAVAEVDAADYAPMYAHFVEEYQRRVEKATIPPHFAAVFVELGDWMGRWARAFA